MQVGVYGKEQSYIGDDVWCPACQSMGKITPDQDRLSTKVNGRMPALNDDSCLCKCNPLPKLVHSQTSFREIIDDYPTKLQQEQLQAQNGITQAFMLQVQLVDMLKNPFANKKYFAINNQGEYFEGTTDSKGYTETIFTKESENFIFHLIENFVE